MLSTRMARADFKNMMTSAKIPLRIRLRTDVMGIAPNTLTRFEKLELQNLKLLMQFQKLQMLKIFLNIYSLFILSV